jgi:hypothetical protein
MHRRLIITEDPALHLLWRLNEIFLKPIPHFLLHFDTFEMSLCHETEESEDIYDAALGLLASYTKLVIFEIDLRIAQDHGLVPPSVSYAQWVDFANSFLQLSVGLPLPPRYDFGELRLSRVNLIYRFSPGLFPRHLIRGYFSDHDRYDTFLESRFRWMLVVFAYISVILSAFQVALGSDQARGTRNFDNVAWIISIISLLFVAGSLATIMILLVLLFVVNALFARHRDDEIRTSRQRFAP